MSHKLPFPALNTTDINNHVDLFTTFFDGSDGFEFLDFERGVSVWEADDRTEENGSAF